MLVNFLKKDPGLKILAFILALTLWAYVKHTSSPLSTLASEARITVPVTVEDLQENLIVLDLPDQVSLTIEGAPQTLAQVKPANFKAFVNLADKKSGIYSVPVKVTLPPDIKLVKIEPATVQIKLDPLAKQLFAVKVKTIGSVAPGFILSSTTSLPESITLSGAQSYLARVKEVRAVCDIEGADMELVQRVALDVVDEDDKVIESLKVEPRFVRTSVKVRSEVKNAVVPISVNLAGNPEPGFVVSKVLVTPSVATIRYRYSLESPPVAIQTEEILIDGAQGSIAREVGLAVPTDVSLVDPQSVKIHVVITPPGSSDVTGNQPAGQKSNAGTGEKPKP